MARALDIRAGKAGRLATGLKRRLVRLATDEPETGFTHLNEAFNAEKSAIFIAVPKAGTTSVREQLRTEGRPLVPDPHLNIAQIRDLLYPYHLLNALGGNGEFPTPATTPTDAELRSRAAETFERCFKFAGVRNPWARAASLYFRDEGVQVKDRMSFDRFCDRHINASDTCRHPTLHRNQRDWLCDEQGTLQMDFVYKVEEFDDAVDRIAELTDGRLRLDRRVANRNPVSRATDYRDLFSDRSRALIAARFEADIDAFGYTF